jgi:hypothetical protein
MRAARGQVATDPGVWAFARAVKGIAYDLSGTMAVGGVHLDT